MTKTLEELEKEISIIKERNAKVELAKAWEISIYRKISILILTYITMIIVMFSL
jgi:hypothetical protein